MLYFDLKIVTGSFLFDLDQVKILQSKRMHHFPLKKPIKMREGRGMEDGISSEPVVVNQTQIELQDRDLD